jgi:hypothetical protein
MWMKGYLALAGVGIIVTAFFVFYAWSWTNSIGDPRIAFAGYDYHRGYALSTTAAWTIILLVAGNVVLWSTRSAIALWLSLAYFVISMASIFVFLTRAVQPVVDAIGLVDGIKTGGGIFLTVICGVALGAMIFFDQLVVVRLRAKLFGDERMDKVEKENSRNNDPES